MEFDFLLALSVPLAAQWINYPAPGIPCTRDRKPNLARRAPRLPWRKTDFSGIWQAESSQEPPQGTNGRPSPHLHFGCHARSGCSRTSRSNPGPPPCSQRTADFGGDDPINSCLPLRHAATGCRCASVQNRPDGRLDDSVAGGRCQFPASLPDGRPLPKDPQTSWMGYIR